MVAASHTADTRHAEVTRKQDALSFKVDALSDMMADALRANGGAAQPRAAAAGRVFGGARARQVTR